MSTPAAAETLSGNVLVWADAPLYLDAKPDAPSIVVGAIDKGHRANYVLPMHVIGTQGDFVEVEPTKDVDCAWTKVVKPKLLGSLHLFVRTADLAPVVTKPYAKTFKNGSQIALQAGVSVQDGRVAIGEQQLLVDVPAANLGLAYTPHPVTAPQKPHAHTAMLDEASQVTLGDKTFDFGPFVAGSAETRGASVLFPIAARCITAVVTVAKDRVQRDVSIGQVYGAELGLGEPRTKGENGYHLGAGQAMTSENGDHVVGTLNGRLEVTKPTGKLVCADFVVGLDMSITESPILEAGRPKRTLHLCAPATQVQQ